MTGPNPPEIILPDGRTGYLNPYSGKYVTNRAYAMRMRRNYSRGLSQSSARGHAPRQGMSEYQLRVQRDQLLYQQTPWQRFTQNFEQRWGFSYSWWQRLRRLYINKINALNSESTPPITEVWIQQELLNNRESHGPEWIEARLGEKLYDMEQYRDGDPLPGRANWRTKDYLSPEEWWWYH